MPAPRTITLQRTGTIKVRVAGKNHCGAESAVVDGMVAVRYTAVLTVDADGLDERGFLVDQERLHQVMVDIGMDPVPWHEPCELLAFVWGKRLLTWISVENTRCNIRAFDLTLSPHPNAGSFTAHWEQPVDSAAMAIPAVRLVS
jgi:hypothetical protein